MKAIKWKKRLNILVIGYFASVSFVNAKDSYSPYADQDYSTNVYWGDTHLHTNLSVDAYNLNNRLSPDDAYRLARGEKVEWPGGVPIQRRRPLDFLVIADHAENIGLMTALEADNEMLLATESGARWHAKLQAILPELRATHTILPELRATEKLGHLAGRSITAEAMTKEWVGNLTFRQSVWDNVTSRADKYNEPGKFTAFSAYEWTNLALFIHRVVIFKDGANKTNQVLPFSQIDSDKPEALWAHLEDYYEKTGGDVLAIPHNANLSRGHMFKIEDSSGKPFTGRYAQTRSRWEPIVEVTQEKGDSETHPSLSPTDEFADFNTRASHKKIEDFDPQLKDFGRQYEYARSVLKLGLNQQAILGVNPFKLGMIGSTDGHLSIPGSGQFNNSRWRIFSPDQIFGSKNWASYDMMGSFAAVWATENTRDALFAAMKRREVYATTGSRITVRFFGGWDYTNEQAFRPDLAKIGYAGGVPMGGDLTNSPKGKTPSFLVRAVKDPDGANLDRVQVIKGWRDNEGELHEKVYNVALSDGRKEHKGKVKRVDSTVDVREASYTNSVGDPELSVVWRDPDFNKEELAFYYVRVLEIPTPRWTAHYANYWGVKEVPDEVSMVIQERAYTSPIWYSPPAKAGGE